MQLLDNVAQVHSFAIAVGVLENGAKHIMLRSLGGRPNNDVESETAGAGLDHINGLRVAALIDKKYIGLFGFADTLRQRHGFGCCSRFIQQGGVGQFHSGQIQDHLLIGQQGLQSTLGDFRLIGCVGGVPARIFQHIAQDYRGSHGVVIS